MALEADGETVKRIELDATDQIVDVLEEEPAPSPSYYRIKRPDENTMVISTPLEVFQELYLHMVFCETHTAQSISIKPHNFISEALDLRDGKHTNTHAACWLDRFLDAQREGIEDDAELMQVVFVPDSTLIA